MINKEEVKKAAVRNAAAHDGKARTGSVISEILGKDRNAVNEIDELKKLAEKAVYEVNSLLHQLLWPLLSSSQEPSQDWSSLLSVSRRI